ncbi:MAG: ATP-binding protein [Gammaproteobacteria bacterium]|nr:ATP-binding protein [Gammaproteobacteria bacterium]
MYKRIISKQLIESLKSYPVLTLLGPRQSGKTTLVRELFKDFDYQSLEDPDIREMATSDPRGFLRQLSECAILDEIQRVPELTSYIQTIVDEPSSKRKFVLTGSNGLLLVDTVTQTLAGRTELFELYPLSVSEITQKQSNVSLNEFLFHGGYPRIYNLKLNPTKWLKSYFQLYVEKDIHLITNITHLDLFEKFIKLSAGRVGQLINASSLSNEVGVSSPTITGWISALKSTYICFTLKPHFRNFNKRIVKTPKLYFYDTGLLCYLLGINSMEQLDTHPLRGNIFENFIVSEYLKKKNNTGEEAELYFWRDQKGHEVDLVEDRSSYLYPIEIKLSETFNKQFIKNIEYLNKLQEQSLSNRSIQGHLLYSGTNEKQYKKIQLENWFNNLKN